jgi:uncharacterized membrane protein YidH (DUF202 family)
MNPADQERQPEPTDDEQEPDYRFTLANERTFLAWIRTALALIAGGIAVAQLVPAFGTARHPSPVSTLPQRGRSGRGEGGDDLLRPGPARRNQSAKYP